MTTVNGWKSLGIVKKSSNLDIGRVSGATTGGELNTGFNFKREGQHQIIEKLSTDYKFKSLLRFYPFLFIRIPFP